MREIAASGTRVRRSPSAPAIIRRHEPAVDARRGGDGACARDDRGGDPRRRTRAADRHRLRRSARPRGIRRLRAPRAAMGYQGKMCIHPDQVAVANDVFTPERGRGGARPGVVAAFADAEAAGWPRSSSTASSSTTRSSSAPAACSPRWRASPREDALMLDVDQASRGQPRPRRLEFLAGPFCATQLGEFGADVIKIELPGSATRPPFRHHEPSAARRSLASEVAQQELHHARPAQAGGRRRSSSGWSRKSDVLVENFQPGTLEGWGLGWDVLQRGQSAPGHGAHLRLRPDRALPGPARLRPHRQRVRRPVVPRRLSRTVPPVTPGSATIPDYIAGTLRRARRDVRAAARGEQTGAGRSSISASTSRSSASSTNWRRPIARRAMCGSAWGRHGQRGAAQPLPDQGRRAGSPSPAPTTRSSPASPG